MLGQVDGRLLEDISGRWVNVMKPSNKILIKWCKDILLFSHSVMSDCFATPWTVAHQVSLSMKFSREECWSRLPFPPPGDLPDPGIKPMSHFSRIGMWILYHWHHLGSPQYSVPLFSVQTHLWESFLSFLSPSWNSPEVILLWQGCKKFRTVLGLLHRVSAYKYLVDSGIFSSSDDL